MSTAGDPTTDLSMWDSAQYHYGMSSVDGRSNYRPLFDSEVVLPMELSGPREMAPLREDDMIDFLLNAMQ